MQQFLIALIIFLTGNIMTVFLFCFAFSLQNVVSCLCVYFNYYQADDAWGNFLSNVGQLWAYVALNGQSG